MEHIQCTEVLKKKCSDSSQRLVKIRMFRPYIVFKQTFQNVFIMFCINFIFIHFNQQKIHITRQNIYYNFVSSSAYNQISDDIFISILSLCLII